MKSPLWKTVIAAPMIWLMLGGLPVYATSTPSRVEDLEVTLTPLDSTVIESSASEILPLHPAQVNLAQVTTVSELSDVRPGDWAFTALQRLVEEYACMEGYSDRTFLGDRILTRYEFAAGLNACLDVVVQLIDSDSDLEGLWRLQEEFAVEMKQIRDRTETLGADVAQLGSTQFSSTTQLQGSLDAHLVVPLGESDIEGSTASEADATFEYWSQLNLSTSFFGEDRLLISVSADDNDGPLANSVSGLNRTSDRTDNPADSVGLEDVLYEFPVGDRVTGKVAANGVIPEDFVSSLIVPFQAEAVAAAGVPEFYDLYSAGDFGAGANVDIFNNLVLDLAYFSDASNDNRSDRGLFNDYSYVAQLNLLTDGWIDAAVVYLDGDQETTLDDLGSISVKPEYTLAGLVSLDFGNVVVAGHYAHSPADGVEGNLNSYMGGVSFPDLFGRNNELGLYGGISPAIGRDPLLLEAYYRLSVNEFFSVTPALIYTDSDAAVDNADNLYGAVRARFSF
ncbi:MAG: iron uptake porin [Cyanobacteria bacterium J06632_3]